MDPIRSAGWRTLALEAVFQGIAHDKPAEDYLVPLSTWEIPIHTLRQAGPDTLIMAIAARPGAVDKAKIVGSVSCCELRYPSLAFDLE